MLSFDKDKFTLVFIASEDQKAEALSDFEKMNVRISNMFKYIENPDTTEAERAKYESKSVEFMRTIAVAADILSAMGISESEVKKRYKF
jgi:hypothetical protein